jgi:hypothetical protein
MQFTTTVKDYFRANTIVHFSLIIGLVFFMLVSFFLNFSGEIQIREVDEIFKIVAPSVVLLAFIVSKMIYRQKIASLQEIIINYRQAESIQINHDHSERNA